MLIERKKMMSLTAASVKTIGRSGLSGLILAATAIAPNAMAFEPILKDRVVTVKFQMADLKADDGTQTVYAKLEGEAKSFCRSSRRALELLDESVEECTADLLDQFVESANIEALSEYHRTMTAPAIVKTAALEAG